MDIFERVKKQRGNIGQYAKEAHGYFAFPKLEGEIGPRMMFRGKEVLNWSLNNYIGLANDPEVRKVDAEAAAQWGLAYPMGARLTSRFDCIVYDAESHACIMDGLRLSPAKRYVYVHNDMSSLRKQLEHATKYVATTGGGILVVTEGVFGMAGDLGKLDEITALKSEFNFRLLVDDAHGFGTMGPTGAGTGEHFGVQDKVDLYFGTFAKAMAGFGAFVATDEDVCMSLRYTMRSQMFAKSLTMPMVEGAIKRLEMLKSQPERREKLWTIAHALQNGLKADGMNIGITNSMVTPVYLSGSVAEGMQVVFDLRENYNIFCSIVVYPVIPKGQLLLRLIPTSMHTLEDVKYTIKAFKNVAEKLAKGEYNKELLIDASKL